MYITKYKLLQKGSPPTNNPFWLKQIDELAYNILIRVDTHHDSSHQANPLVGSEPD